MVETLPTDAPGILAFKFSGKLHDEDYKAFVPLVDAAVETHGKIRLLAWFEDLQGWDMHAAWDDLKFGISHYSDFDRLAVIGDKCWEEWMTRFARPFTDAKVKYFDASESDAAWSWIREQG